MEALGSGDDLVMTGMVTKRGGLRLIRRQLRNLETTKWHCLNGAVYRKTYYLSKQTRCNYKLDNDVNMVQTIAQ